MLNSGSDMHTTKFPILHEQQAVVGNGDLHGFVQSSL